MKPEHAKTARDVIALMNGTEIENDCGDYIRGTIADGTIYLLASPYGNAKKWEIRDATPREIDGRYSTNRDLTSYDNAQTLPNNEIGVSLEASPEKIVKEIQRRLLPGMIRRNELYAARLAEHNDYRASVESIKATCREFGCDFFKHGGGDSGRIYQNGHSVDIQASHNSATLKMDVPRDKLYQVLQLLTT